jgi:hypothetical protein
MQLSVSLVEGFSYLAAAQSLPFWYHVAFEEDTTILGSIKATACLVKNKADNEIIVGYVKNITSLPGTERLITAGTEVVLTVDALEHEETPSGLVPGAYEVSARISVQVSMPDGSHQHRELRASQRLVLQ